MAAAQPLLCELHSHTTWSDGALSLRGLCDLYGRSGFDVLAVTDHTSSGPGSVRAGEFGAYLEEIEAEGARARRLYDLLLLPGLELTFEHDDPTLAGHAVAVGLRTFVGVDEGLEDALRASRAHGAALVAAHPYRLEDLGGQPRSTAAFASRPERFAPLVDRFELFNRETLFGWVAEAGLPVVASGDFHRLEHLSGWKTLLPCEKEEAAVVDYLRTRRPAYLVRLSPRPAYLGRLEQGIGGLAPAA